MVWVGASVQNSWFSARVCGVAAAAADGGDLRRRGSRLCGTAVGTGVSFLTALLHCHAAVLAASRCGQPSCLCFLFQVQQWVFLSQQFNCDTPVNLSVSSGKLVRKTLETVKRAEVCLQKGSISSFL